MENKKSYSVHSLARLSGISIRTLHYYDQIGLLVPDRSPNGYRIYHQGDVLRLQQILLHRETGLPLEQIKKTLDHPHFDHLAALEKQRSLLIKKANTMQKMIFAIEAAIQKIETGKEVDMSIFDGFEFQKHDDEAKQRWGETAPYRECQNRIKSYDKDDILRLKDEERTLTLELRDCFLKGHSPSDEISMAFAEKHRLYIEHWFYPCSKDFHQRLGLLYVGDEKFSLRYNQLAHGLADFFKHAIDANAAKPYSQT